MNRNNNRRYDGNHLIITFIIRGRNTRKSRCFVSGNRFRSGFFGHRRRYLRNIYRLGRRRRSGYRIWRRRKEEREHNEVTDSTGSNDNERGNNQRNETVLRPLFKGNMNTAWRRRRRATLSL
jgi:hypothetical protein